MEEHKILFTTDATITFDEYVRYSNRMCRFKNILSYILWIGITGAFCAWAEGLKISEEDAWQLAREQTAFHDCAMEIGTESGTVGELAYDLQKTRTWYFMWEL